MEVAVIPFPPVPAALDADAAHFDDLFTRPSQRQAFRQYLAGLLLPAERTKTLTALAHPESVGGAQAPSAQRLPWFLSESLWDAAAVTARRLAMLRADPATAPHAGGVLIVDESGDRKDGEKTAHVGRQYLGNRGKSDNGVVSVGSLWADESVYYPLAVEPYTPERWFAGGKTEPAFRTKPQIALELVAHALAAQWPLRAVVADGLYGEHHGFTHGLEQCEVPYVVARKPSHAWWAPVAASGAVWEVAAASGWVSAEQPGDWVPVERTFRDGHTQTWWALEGRVGPYGPDRSRRLVIATPDPATLPEAATWYLATTLPRAEADLAEIVRLSGLRHWVEQHYKQIKQSLGWSQYQVRSDRAIRRHWALVQGAFACWWWAETRIPLAPPPAAAREAPGEEPGEKVAGADDVVLASGVALLARLERPAPTAPAPGAAGLAARRPPPPPL